MVVACCQCPLSCLLTAHSAWFAGGNDMFSNHSDSLGLNTKSAISKCAFTLHPACQAHTFVM
jgi:hypothetical protein